jgi:hypothetical protein
MIPPNLDVNDGRQVSSRLVHGECRSSIIGHRVQDFTHILRHVHVRLVARTDKFVLQQFIVLRSLRFLLDQAAE